MVEGAPLGAQDFVEPWMRIAATVLSRPPDAHADAEARLTHYETEVVRLSLDNLLSFPWIADPVAAGTLRIEGFRFDIHTGTLARLEETGFVAVRL